MKGKISGALGQLSDCSAVTVTVAQSTTHEQRKVMKRLAITLSVLAAVCAVSTPAMADEAMAKAKGCLACHKTDAKLIGPSYKEVAAKYSAADVDKLAEKVQKGGKGVWGAVPMAPNKVTPEEAKQLVTWILSLK